MNHLGKTSSVQELSYSTFSSRFKLKSTRTTVKLQLESHAVYRDYANEYSLALHQAKMEANKTSQSLLSLG